MDSHDDDNDLGDKHHLINKTADTDDLGYESMMGKRNKGASKYADDEDRTKGRKVKIILLILLGVVALTGLILIIIDLSSGKGNIIENRKDYNMFKLTQATVGINSATFMLNSKIKTGQICENVNNTFVDSLVGEVSMITGGVMRTVFKDPKNPNRWNLNDLGGFINDRKPDPLTMLDSVGFSFPSVNSDFSIKTTDQISNNSMFDTTNRAFVFTDKYIEIGFNLPSQVLFGLGQHNSKFLLSPGNWTMFNRDQPGSPVEKGEGKQMLYGTHPFLMVKTQDNKFQGILFYNSNPQQVFIEFSKSGKSVITYRTVGGILDIYTFAADTADNIIRRYNDLVGHPEMPPFWALGFHQCSWQYSSTTDLKTVVDTYTSKGYLFDTIWSDIMYMDKYIDFTVDDVNFKGLKDYINTLHSANLHFVPIVDAGVSISPDSKGVNWYEIGKKFDVYIKSSQNPTATDGGYLIAQVWPGYTAFVDFLHPNAIKFWSQGLQALYDLIPYDGLWLDMNEPSNFCSKDDGKTPLGECYPDASLKEWNGVKTNLDKEPQDVPVKPGQFDYIPFIPGGDPLITKTISMDAYLYDPNKTPTGSYNMYNVHNIYGTLETKATYEFLTGRDDRRPLIISRDSFVGHGKFGSIWTGDNDATFEHMTLSINQIMSFSMFGMPFVGSDICGFGGDSSAELCARWASVGAFYPFMRNHYAIDKKPQEFYLWPDKFQVGMKQSLRQRYSLLRYMYTSLYRSHAFGDPTIRHPLYDYPSIDEMVNDQNSFFIGKCVRVTANFNMNETAPFSAYFPPGKWFDLQNYKLTTVKDKVQKLDLYKGFDYTNVHVRGGSIIPIQDASETSNIKNTHDLLESQMRLLILPTDKGYAEGSLYIARGELRSEQFQYYTITYSNKRIQFRFDNGDLTDYGTQYNEVLEEIHVVGDSSVLDSDFACLFTRDQVPKSLIAQKVIPATGDPYLRIYGGVNTVEFDLTESIIFGKIGRDENLCDKGYYATKGDMSDKKQVYTLTKNAQGSNAASLTLTLQLVEFENIQLTITDGTNRFTVPQSAFREGKPPSPSISDAKIDDYVTVSGSTSKFTLQIHEYKDPTSIYFEIGADSLIFTDYFLSLDTSINTNSKIYGLGERVTNFFLSEGIYTTWAFDTPDPIDDGKKPGKNVYGTHPVYFTRSKSGKKYHWGMLNLNANAQDTKVTLSGKYGGQISHYISGQGIFDMYFFLDNATPEAAIKKYHGVIGNTLLPPFWSMGWHQCKYGYKNTAALQEVYDNYNKGDFPMDTLWSDIDHMYKYRDFTYDKDGNFKDLPDFIRKTLHANNRKYVPIVDAGIAIVHDGTYSVFDKGKQFFIKSGNPMRNGKTDVIKDMAGILYGKCWPGYAGFPDWTNPGTTGWWVDSLKGFHTDIEFDGIWLDMNEVANFCAGACIPEDVVNPEDSVVGKLIYSPGSRNVEEKSLSVDGVHSDKWTQLNYHSLFGFMQGIATNKYFSDSNQRSLIIARSTFAGQGKFTSHWLGDNFSEFPYLKYSISGVLSMNVFGINFAGADICGFLGVTNENLCQKWMTVGAFYPFARNHDDIGNEGQEPYRFSDAAQATMRNALRWRYALLRYYYTQMFLSHTNGGTFWKPLFFEFPDQDHAYDDIERNIMIGPSIKFSPMLDETDAATQKFIMPAGGWCNIIDYTFVKQSSISDVALPTTRAAINLHLRPGHIIPLQRNAVEKKVMNTVDLNSLPMGLMINPDSTLYSAAGTFYADNGIDLVPSSQTYINMKFSYDGKKNAKLEFTATLSGYRDKYTELGLIEIVGANYSNLYSLKKIKIDGGAEIIGTFDSGNRLLRFQINPPVEMSTIKTVEFYS